MKGSYLEVTYRQGKPIAAYYYLPRRVGQRSYRTERVAPGIIVDFSRTGRPIGIEIAAPTIATQSALNRVLKQYGHAPVKRADLAPLRAA